MCFGIRDICSCSFNSFMHCWHVLCLKFSLCLCLCVTVQTYRMPTLAFSTLTVLAVSFGHKVIKNVKIGLSKSKNIETQHVNHQTRPFKTANESLNSSTLTWSEKLLENASRTIQRIICSDGQRYYVRLKFITLCVCRKLPPPHFLHKVHREWWNTFEIWATCSEYERKSTKIKFP